MTTDQVITLILYPLVIGAYLYTYAAIRDARQSAREGFKLVHDELRDLRENHIHDLKRRVEQLEGLI